MCQIILLRIYDGIGCCYGSNSRGASVCYFIYSATLQIAISAHRFLVELYLKEDTEDCDYLPAAADSATTDSDTAAGSNSSSSLSVRRRSGRTDSDSDAPESASAATEVRY